MFMLLVHVRIVCKVASEESVGHLTCSCWIIRTTAASSHMFYFIFYKRWHLQKDFSWITWLAKIFNSTISTSIYPNKIWDSHYDKLYIKVLTNKNSDNFFSVNRPVSLNKWFDKLLVKLNIYCVTASNTLKYSCIKCPSYK